ncbi:MAG: polyprenyl synthetase family protein [Saprospiraceae bacterium]
MHTLPQLLARIADYAAANPFPAAPNELYEPCDYMLTLGGKRLRPAFLLMACELFSDHIEHALPAAWAVELFHNFTLLHDDIMDAAPLRRGQPTVHTRWNTTTGILSGDVMLIHAYQHIVATGTPEIVADLIQIFNRVATEVCEGQQYDMNFETRHDVQLAEYLRMIELKTAVLLGGALEMGARCAGASTADREHLYHFGRLAGIAFQIQDDLLDTYGDPAKFGKQVGGDILQNKKTWLVLKVFEAASPGDEAELRHWMQTDQDAPGKVAAVRAIFDRNNVPERAAEEKQQFQNEAFSHLQEVSAPEVRKTILKKTVGDLLERDS